MSGSKAGASVVCVVLIVFLDKNLIFQLEFLMSISNALLYQRSCGKRMSWCRLCSVNSLFDKSKNPSFSTGVLEFMTWQADVDLLRFTFSADIERKHNLAVKQKNEKAVIQTKFLEIRSQNNQMEEQLKKTEKDKQLLAARVDDLEIRIENSERQTAAAIAECEQLRCQLSEAKSLEASQAEILKIKEDDIVTLQAEVEVWYICSEIFLAFFPLKTGFLHVQRALYTSRLQIL
jgi:hypothetical protein